MPDPTAFGPNHASHIVTFEDRHGKRHCPECNLEARDEAVRADERKRIAAKLLEERAKYPTTFVSLHCRTLEELASRIKAGTL